MGKIKIKNLLIRSYVGFNQHEVGKKQDVLLNVEIVYDSSLEEKSDQPEDALDYRTITKTIIDQVEKSRFNLIEALARMVLELLMENSRVQSAEVEIDKPHALRYAESVSVTLSALRDDVK